MTQLSIFPDSTPTPLAAFVRRGRPRRARRRVRHGKTTQLGIIDTDHGSVMLPGGPGWKGRLHRQMKQQRQAARKPLKPAHKPTYAERLTKLTHDQLAGEYLKWDMGTAEKEQVRAEFVRREPEAWRLSVEENALMGGVE